MPAIRRGGAADLPAVDAIQRRSPEASQWNPESYLQYDFFVAIEDGTVAGFVSVRAIGPEEYEILNLAVAPEWRRRGVAHRLLSTWLEGVSGDVFLEVRESNLGAQKFYKSLGFQQVTYRSNYYQDPPEAAIVMKFHSC